jgi:phospholipid/cholesterol/gamma-HCH transport system substrate-binding protein
MENKVNLSVVGAFVIVLTVAMIAGGLWLASGMYNRKAYDLYETYMTESVSGLNLNSTVRYRGVEVGFVRQIILAPGNVEQVRVRLEIERGTPVKTDTVAILQTQGLTGISYVELRGGRKDSPALQAAPGQEVPVIASRPSLMERLETATPVLMANLSRAVDNLNALLDETNRNSLRSTLADLAVLTQTLAKRSSMIDATLVSSARTMANTASLSAQLPQLVQRFEHAADALERMATDVSDASVRAVRSTRRAARSTARAPTWRNSPAPRCPKPASWWRSCAGWRPRCTAWSTRSSATPACCCRGAGRPSADRASDQPCARPPSST